MKLLTTSEFIRRSRLIHGEKYNYSKSKYINGNTKITITCPIHGNFMQFPSNHWKGCSCPKCAKTHRYSNKEFILKSKEIHGNKYDYSKTEYTKSQNKLTVTCKQHGDFSLTANHHIRGVGCPKCARKRNIKACKSNSKEFIQKSKSIHGDLYDYSKVEYVNDKTNVCIICTKHGEFNQLPNNHKVGKGCPKCRSSKGEIQISEILNSLNVNYMEQHRFEDCRNRNPLPFDFYLPELNICIEYDGEQHFVPKFNMTHEDLKQVQLHDQIKTEYCKENNIRLIRIRYDEDIETRLNDSLVYRS